MSLITLMNIVRVDSTFYYAKLQFDAGGRSLESLLNTRRRSNVCVPTGWKNSIRSLRRREYKRSIDARRPRVVSRDNPVFSNPISIKLSPRFSFRHGGSFRKRKGKNRETFPFCTNSTRALSRLIRKKKKEKFSSNGILLCFAELASRSRVYRALDRIPA